MENEGIMNYINWVVIVTVFGMFLMRLKESYFHSNCKTFLNVMGGGMGKYILGSLILSHTLFWFIYPAIEFINFLFSDFISQDFLENEIYTTLSILSGIIVSYDLLYDPGVVKNYTYYIADENNWLTNPEIRKLRREIVKPNNDVRKIKNNIFKERDTSNSYYFLDGSECVKIYDDKNFKSGCLHKMIAEYKPKNKETYFTEMEYFW